MREGRSKRPKSTPCLPSRSTPTPMACWHLSRGSRSWRGATPRRSGGYRKFPAWCRRSIICPRGAFLPRAAPSPMTAAARNIRPTNSYDPGTERPAGIRRGSMVGGMANLAVAEVVAAKGSARSSVPVIEVAGLKKHFPVKKGLLRRTACYVYAVDGVSFSIDQGETLGLVGESGCGKSTVARTVLRLVEPTAGSIKLDGADITRLGKSAMRPHRRQMQIIFQDPFSSLNPRMSAGDIVGEPLQVHGLARGKEMEGRVAALFDQVGLRRLQMRSFPHEFSGGQRQRICIARALALNPNLIIGDEPVSALDVSIQAQVINLMMDLQREKNLSYLFIAHDLAVVEHISHRIAVMYLGKIVEYTDKETLFTNPLHPYTEALLAAVPIPNPQVKRKKHLLQGDVPSPINPPPGCTFHTRCPYAEARCRTEVPLLREVNPGHTVACHLR